MKLWKDQTGSAATLALPFIGLLAGAAMVNQAGKLNSSNGEARNSKARIQGEMLNQSAINLLRSKICSDENLLFEGKKFVKSDSYNVIKDQLSLPVAFDVNSQTINDIFSGKNLNLDQQETRIAILDNQFPDTMDIKVYSQHNKVTVNTNARIDCTGNLYTLAQEKAGLVNKQEEVIETFEYGTPDPKVDYLFVIDNSSSTRKLIASVYQGFMEVLMSRDNFSNDSKVAVMMTGVAKLDDFSQLHGGYGRSPAEKYGINMMDEPGYLDFVTGPAIKAYREKHANNVSIQNNYKIDGCNNAWFRPYQKTSDRSNYCLRAALQTSLFDVGAEAGITAFEQMLIKNVGKRVFRKDAIVNVIFVSDTHDPGTGSKKLLANIKSHKYLLDLVRMYNKVANLKFHAIAPGKSKECSTEQFSETTYYNIAKESDGTIANICSSPNFGSIMKKLVKNSKERDPEFQLKSQDVEILGVEIDGRKTKNYDLKDGILSVKGLNPKKEVELKVSYLTAS